MFTERKKLEFLNREFHFLWAALAFQAGFANAGGFLACARFVSHMTGFGTQVGMSLSELDYLFALELVSAPLSFLIGAMISGVFVDRPIVQGRKPQYLWVLWIIVAIYSVIAFAGIGGHFGKFGEPMRLKRDFVLMGLLCCVCGMQNACFASLTRGQIRTTHLTGILTDIGTTFVRLISLEPGSREVPILSRTNGVRMLTFFSFSFGSMVSAVLFVRLEHAAFGILLATSLGIVLVVLRKNRQRLQQRFGYVPTKSAKPVEPNPMEREALPRS